MGRLRAAAMGGVTIALSASLTAFAAPSAMQVEPAMRLTLEVSVPTASEAERDLLRREYRLSQAASEFWAGFDSLNARIHGAADLLRSLRRRIEETPPSLAGSTSLLTGLEASPAGRAPAATLQQPAPAPASPTEEASRTQWMLLAAVLGGLTLLLFRRRRAGQLPAGPVRRAAAASAAALPASVAPPAEEEPSTPVADEAGLKRNTVPTPVAPPPVHVDRVREEMDHALDLAEVMLSYGRTTGAMQALKDYLHDHPTISVRPWLKLLDLHRQTGMREDFERAAETVHRHFNVRVPDWDEDVSGVPLRSFFDDEEHTELLGLEQIPHLLAKIQATWPDESCLEYLRHLLVDNRGGGRMGFPVSVVAEILLLEDILNDRLAGPA